MARTENDENDIPSDGKHSDTFTALFRDNASRGEDEKD
jgi:hypothetical protein